MIPTSARREDSLRRSSARHLRLRAVVSALALTSAFLGLTTIAVAETSASRPPTHPAQAAVPRPPTATRPPTAPIPVSVLLPVATTTADTYAPIADFAAGRAAVVRPPSRASVDTPDAVAGSVVRERIRARGQATWYCLRGVSACHRDRSGGLYAAAGAELRVGDWRGRKVTVCRGDACIRVTLIDWCACAGDRVIDLYGDAFRRLASLSAGTIAVTVRW